MGSMWKTADCPNPKDPFDETDTDGSGGLDQEELETLTEKLSEIKGEKIDVEEVLAAYDANEDGVLSEEEVNSFMSANGAISAGSKTALNTRI